MYNFSTYKEKDKQKIMDFMETNPFAFITGSFLSGSQVATQIPILVEERNGKLYLQGHIMRKTDHYTAFAENPQVLVVFTGAHCYVSASWYSTPQMGSTWNYMSVHVNGTVRFMSPEELVTFMKKFTLKFEGGNTQSPTIFENLTSDYTQKMLPAISGFEIEAEKVEHVFKLSQNRDEKSYLNIISHLEKQGGNASLIAGEMQQRIPELFK